DRLRRRDRVVGVRAAEPEEVGDAPTAAAALGRDRRRRRRALPDPAVLWRGLLAERADVDELRALLRGVAHRPFAHEQRPLADRAETHRRNLRNPHEFDYSRLAEPFPDLYCVLHVCFTCRAMRGPRTRHHRGHRWRVFARVERFTEPALLLLLRERPAHGYDLLERLPEL